MTTETRIPHVDHACHPGNAFDKSNIALPQVNGLVHISQLADEFVANCDDHVKDGDTVRNNINIPQRI